MPRRPDLPCSSCGVLMWRSTTSAAAPRCGACRKRDRCGTYNGYSKGCRCDGCRGAYNAYMRGYRVRRRIEGRPLTRGPSGDWISKADREMVYFRDDFVCQLCFLAVDMAADYMAENAPTLDHIVPRALGGTDDLWNLRLACRGCNSARGANPDWEVPDGSEVVLARSGAG